MEPTVTKFTDREDTIAAIATPPGVGGLAVVRISGPDALTVLSRIWRGKNPDSWVSHTAHLGSVVAEDGSVTDSVVATFYRAPHSFTGEDTVEISMHGSRWIQREMMLLICRQGARPANPGEFTQRAFMNRRLDLAQAEGVAELISASSRAAHKLALSQMTGAFSRRLEELRRKLVEFASLMELEIDFSEEDVEFADRRKLLQLSRETLAEVRNLASTYSAGRAFREGIPVAIAGVPNVGKSSLLNYILGDDKAIVSDIPGTTRDIIEDTREIEGVLFRFYDTAGLRDSEDEIERIGISRTENRIGKASIVLWIIDPTQELEPQIAQILHFYNANMDSRNIIVVNKADLIEAVTEDVCTGAVNRYFPVELDAVPKVVISVKRGEGIDRLTGMLAELATSEHNPDSELIVTNARHYNALMAGAESLDRAIEGLENALPSDLVALDVREAAHHLATLTGAISTDTLLSNIFSRFCIGK